MIAFFKLLLKKKSFSISRISEPEDLFMTMVSAWSKIVEKLMSAVM